MSYVAFGSKTINTTADIWIYGYIQKHYAHYAKEVNEPHAFPLTKTMSKHEMVSLFHTLEQKAYERGVDFAGTPVLYRTPRHNKKTQ